MPQTITLYGASDDLIEVEGAVSEEFSHLDEEETVRVAFVGGAVLTIEYSNAGVWRITEAVTVEGSPVEIVKAPEGDDDNYSDRATVTIPDGVRPWVLVGKLVRA